MALTVLTPSSQNLSDIDPAVVNTYVNVPVYYTYNSSNKWIYCNYIEYINNTNYLGDKSYGNKCLNQQVVQSGTHQIFFSYQYDKNILPNESYIGIQIFNPNTSAITYTELNSGYGSNYSDPNNQYKNKGYNYGLGSWESVAGPNCTKIFNRGKQLFGTNRIE